MTSGRYFWIARDKSGGGQMNYSSRKLKLDKEGFFRSKEELLDEDPFLCDNESADRLLRTLGAFVKRGEQVRARIEWSRRA